MQGRRAGRAFVHDSSRSGAPRHGSVSRPPPRARKTSLLRRRSENRPAWSLGVDAELIPARVISGLIFSLPIVITFWIVYWIFMTLEQFLLNPLAVLINRIQAWMRDSPALQELDLPQWWYNIGSPFLAILLALAILYLLGLIFRSWVYRTLEWFLLHVPIVATIYRAVRNVVESLGTQLRGGGEFKRVVLVPFPSSRLAFARPGDQLAARRHDRPHHPHRLRAHRRDASGRLHAVRPGRVRDEHRLERQRDAPVHPLRRHHRPTDDPLLRGAPNPEPPRQRRSPAPKRSQPQSTSRTTFVAPREQNRTAWVASSTRTTSFGCVFRSHPAPRAPQVRHRTAWVASPKTTSFGCVFRSHPAPRAPQVRHRTAWGVSPRTTSFGCVFRSQPAPRAPQGRHRTAWGVSPRTTSFGCVFRSYPEPRRGDIVQPGREPQDHVVRLRVPVLSRAPQGRNRTAWARAPGPH